MSFMTPPLKQACAFAAVLGVLSLPFYTAGPLLGSLTGLTRASLPVSALMVICPAAAALLLAAGTGTLGQLVGRLRQPPRGKYWLLAIPAMPTVIFCSALLGGQGAGFETAPGAVAGVSVIFLLGALAEETGWTAFLLPRIMTALGERAAGPAIGTVSALWHLVPYIQAGHPGGWILGQCLFTVIFHCLLVRLVVGSGGLSVWPAVLAHAGSNVAWALSPRAGAGYDPWIAAALTGTLLLVLAGAHALHRAPAAEAPGKKG